MRRNLPPTQRHRSQSISCVTAASLSPSAKSNTTPLQHQLQYDTRSESTNSSPIHGRRESLVKPTWQNIRPGQIPLKTLDKINGIISDSDNEDSDCVRRSSLSYANTASCAANTSIASAAAAGIRSQQQTNVRKHSGGHLGQLTRKGSLVVHRDSLSSNASLKSARSSIDNSSTSAIFASSSAQSTDAKINKSTSSRSLVRMLSNKCTAAHSSEEDINYDILAKVSAF